MGLKLTHARVRIGMTQQQLAEASGVPQSVISDIESGSTRDPRIETLRRLTSVLGCTVDDLLNNEEKEESK